LFNSVIKYNFNLDIVYFILFIYLFYLFCRKNKKIEENKLRSEDEITTKRRKIVHGPNSLYPLSPNQENNNN